MFFLKSYKKKAIDQFNRDLAANNKEPMLCYWTAPSPTKTRETPRCLAKTLPFPLTPKAKSTTTTTTTTLWVLWYIFPLNNKPLFYSYSDFVFVLFGKLLARNAYCLQTLFYTCDTSRKYNPTKVTFQNLKTLADFHIFRFKNKNLLYSQMNKLESNLTSCIYIFIIKLPFNLKMTHEIILYQVFKLF